MDVMIHELSRATNEQARRAILQNHALDYPRLLEQPEFPEPLRPFDPDRMRRDYLLFIATLSAFGQEGMLLFRCIYTGDFGSEPPKELVDFSIIEMVDYFELALATHEDSTPFWVALPFRFLPNSVLNAIDDAVLEYERSKIAYRTRS